MNAPYDTGLQDTLVAEPTHPYAQRLLSELLAGYAQARTEAADPHTSRPLQAHLVLETWSGNPIAEWLAAHAPAVAADRRAVPDPIYEGRENDAPAVVPLPFDWAAVSPSNDSRLLLDALPHWIEAAWLQSEKRLQPQSLCGIAFSSASAAGVAAHSAQLTFQRSPVDGAPRYFRHHDPRVMQRVWPELSPIQQRTWLGPIAQWWAIRQAWGPWTFDELVAIDASALSNPPRWSTASCPREPNSAPSAQVDKTQLLNTAQWAAAHSAPHGNQAWAQHAGVMTPAGRQPGADAMTETLAFAASLPLRDTDLAAFIDASWAVAEEVRLPPGVTPWQKEPYASALRQTLAHLATQPEAPFSASWLLNRPQISST